MTNKGTIKLETERLILRKGNVSDSTQIYENYGKDQLVSKYVVWNKQFKMIFKMKYLKVQEKYILNIQGN